MQAVKCVQSLHARVASIHGFSGTGKTVVLSVIAAWLLSLGFHVALSAPSHAATDHLLAQTAEILRHSFQPEFTRIEPMRVYREMLETREFLRPKVQSPTVEQDVVGKQDDNAKGAPDDSEAIANAAMLSMAQRLKNSLHGKSFKLGQCSFQAHVLQYAEACIACGSQLLMSYADNVKKPKSVVEAGETSRTERDMYSELLLFATKLSEGGLPYTKWTEEEKNRFTQAYHHVSDTMMQDQCLCAATTNTVGGPLIRKSFGRKSIGIAQEEGLQNSIHARARRGMVTLYNHKITSDQLGAEWWTDKVC